jgi:hypothetical protein
MSHLIYVIKYKYVLGNQWWSFEEHVGNEMRDAELYIDPRKDET